MRFLLLLLPLFLFAAPVLAQPACDCPSAEDNARATSWMIKEMGICKYTCPACPSCPEAPGCCPEPGCPPVEDDCAVLARTCRRVKVKVVTDPQGDWQKCHGFGCRASVAVP